MCHSENLKFGKYVNEHFCFGIDACSAYPGSLC